MGERYSLVHDDADSIAEQTFTKRSGGVEYQVDLVFVATVEDCYRTCLAEG